MQLRNQMSILFTPVDEAVTTQIQQATPVGDYPIGKAPMPRIHVRRGFSTFGDFDVNLLVIRLFKTGETLDQFISDHMKKNRPDVKVWYYELYYPPSTEPIETFAPEKSKEANAWFDFLLKDLESNSVVEQLRADYRELKNLGAKAVEQIDKELRKPVAPKISS